MLLTEQEVSKACNLNTYGVKEALAKNGYDASDISDSVFLGMNPRGVFVYEITYRSQDDDDATGKVYLSYTRDAFSKDFYLTGEF